MEVYKQPLYYEIAFSFFDPKKQVDNFEKIIQKFSRIKPRRFLDIACGPSLQLREIARRGYEAIGLDLNSEMLEYLKNKAAQESLQIETVQADMCNFKLGKKADFAFIMMGSLCVESNEKFLAHLDSVASSLNNGGLYLIQNVALDWIKLGNQSWSMERDGITVRTSFEHHFKDTLNQIGTERLVLEVVDKGEAKRFVYEEDLKFIFPQEFKTLVKLNGKFEFLGWWEGDENQWFLDKPLEKSQNPNMNIVLLRRL